MVDESREYGTWADWMGVPRHTFSAVFGAVIAKRLDYRETFQVFRPGVELDKARRLTLKRAEGGLPAVELAIEGLHALPFGPRLGFLADVEGAVHASGVPASAPP